SAFSGRPGASGFRSATQVSQAIPARERAIPSGKHGMTSSRIGRTEGNAIACADEKPFRSSESRPSLPGSISPAPLSYRRTLGALESVFARHLIIVPTGPLTSLPFATHALVAGDLSGLAEPALVLTPPDIPTEADDGLVTASEIATL